MAVLSLAFSALTGLAFLLGIFPAGIVFGVLAIGFAVADLIADPEDDDIDEDDDETGEYRDKAARDVADAIGGK